MRAAGNSPQHRTVCEFRRRHLEDFKTLFVAVFRLARELGLARFRKLSIGGTKGRVNASKRKAMSFERMQEEERRLGDEIQALLRAAEDARFGADVRGDDLPAELCRRENRLAATAQSNFTDPESVIMKTSSEGFQQCYNAPVAVDGAHQVVVATDLTANASDQGGLPSMSPAATCSTAFSGGA